MSIVFQLRTARQWSLDEQVPSIAKHQVRLQPFFTNATIAIRNFYPSHAHPYKANQRSAHTGCIKTQTSAQVDCFGEVCILVASNTQLAVIIPAPAHDDAAGVESAGMKTSSYKCSESHVWHRE